MPTKPPRMRRPSGAAPVLRKQSATYGWAKGSDRRWRKLRQSKLDHDPLCQRCAHRRRIVAATEVHHIVPISKGGEKYDWGNLLAVCGACQDELHGAKPRRPLGPDGTPLVSA